MDKHGGTEVSSTDYNKVSVCQSANDAGANIASITSGADVGTFTSVDTVVAAATAVDEVKHHLKSPLLSSTPTKLYQYNPVDVQVSKMQAHTVDNDKVEQLRKNLDTRQALVGLHDTPGGLSIESTMAQFYRMADAIVLTFSLYDRKSFINVN